MSRSGYGDEWDYDGWWPHIQHRGAVASALRGKRGQAFLQEMLEAMSALPLKRLIAHELEDADLIPCSHWGLFETRSVCAIGSVGKRRGIDMSGLDPEDYQSVANTFGISSALAQEIVYMNDEANWNRETPEQRFERMRSWIESELYQKADSSVPAHG